MVINEKILPSGNFFSTAHDKKFIVLHHTVTETAGPAYDWFNSNRKKIGTAYIIEKDGTVIKCFEPAKWAFHIGKGATLTDNKNSIGIEIVNEGCLIKKGEKFLWFNGKHEFKNNNIIRYKWRDQEYWAGYTLKQFEAVKELIKQLSKRFHIPLNLVDNFEYNPSLLKNFRGICSHCNLRKDKLDISPAFPLLKLKEELNREVNYDN